MSLGKVGRRFDGKKTPKNYTALSRHHIFDTTKYIFISTYTKGLTEDLKRANARSEKVSELKALI